MLAMCFELLCDFWPMCNCSWFKTERVGCVHGGCFWIETNRMVRWARQDLAKIKCGSLSLRARGKATARTPRLCCVFVAMRLTGPEAVVRCAAASSGLTSNSVYFRANTASKWLHLWRIQYLSLVQAVLRTGAVLSKIVLCLQVISQTCKRKLLRIKRQCCLTGVERVWLS